MQETGSINAIFQSSLPHPTKELNLTSRVELFVNFKRVELEFKKSSYQTRVECQDELIFIESSRAQTSSTRLISSPNGEDLYPIYASRALLFILKFSNIKSK
jgi:hypothetical protein